MESTRMSHSKKSWQQIGEDPDYRFSFANERTYLAWIRTSLAITAGCVLLSETMARTSALMHYAIVALAVLGAVLSGTAYMQWLRCEIAMRLRLPLPHNPALLLVLALALVAAGAAFMHLLKA